MKDRTTRREILIEGGRAAVALAAMGIPESVWALQDGEELVDFADYTSQFRIEYQQTNPRVRCFDLRRLTSWATPNDEFYAFHQTQTMQVDADSWRLRINGFVDRPMELTLDDLKARSEKREEAVTLECSGNSPRAARMSGLLSNGVWSGVALAPILAECGVKPEAREVVFLGTDMEKEGKWQARGEEYEIPHGRSVYIQDAMNPEAMLAYELNGEPLPPDSGYPLRLILPGWYGMTQIKWLTRIEVLDRRYEGEHMARNYLSLRSRETPEGTLWLDTSISKNNKKSVVARVTRHPTGNTFAYKISGAAWGGQIPIESVEVRVDEGPWRKATIDDRRGKYAWMLWSIDWPAPGTGEHTLVSRAIDTNGHVQPTFIELKKEIASGRENYSQWPRPIVIGD
jgi:DMSO/TMAO reductase YedYZ molybdopterin-dependent catalytic subunit